MEIPARFTITNSRFTILLLFALIIGGFLNLILRQRLLSVVIMTTITTVVGLLPLAILGGEFWYGMAIVIMSGLSVGTLLSLGFIPVLYSLFFDNALTKTVNNSEVLTAQPP